MSVERDMILEHWRDGRSIAGIQLELEIEGIKRSAIQIDRAIHNARAEGRKIPPAEKQERFSTLLDKRADLHWISQCRRSAYASEIINIDNLDNALSKSPTSPEEAA